MRRTRGRSALPSRSLGLTLAALLVGLAVDARAQVFEPGASGYVGVIGTWQTYQAGLAGQPFLQGAAEVRTLFAGSVAIDGWVNAGVALNQAGARSGYTMALRGGIALPGATVLVGPLVQTAPESPAQVALLPSITATFGTKQLRGVVGVFDRLGVAPLRLGAEFELAGVTFGAAYVPVLGLDLMARLGLGGGLALEVRALTNLILNAGTGNVVVGLHWSPGATPEAK